MNPPKALQSIRSVASGETIVAGVYEPETDVLAHPVPRYLGGWEKFTWWLPSLACLRQTIVDAGFHEAEVFNTFPMSSRDGGTLWRTVIRAYAQIEGEA